MVRVFIAVLAAVAAAVTVLTLMGVNLDLQIAQLFYDPVRKGFPNNHPLALIRDNGAVALVTCLAAVISAVGARVFRLKTKIVSARAAFFLASTLALGPGLLVNGILKEHWDRPRPAHVKQFGGDDEFVNWWNPGGTCERNCSFVSGEVSSAAWMFAPAMLTPPQWRVAAFAGAAVFTAVISVARMAAGRHFLTDVLFAALLTLILICGMHWLIFRWRQPAEPP